MKTVTRNILLSVFLFSVQLHAEKTKIAIYDPKINVSLSKSLSANEVQSLGYISNAFRVQLESKIASTKKFDVIVRKDLKDIIKEQELSQSGLVDPNSDNIAQLGKIDGVEFVLVNEVVSYSDITQRRELETLGRVIEKRDISISVVSKLYNSTNGKIQESYESNANFSDAQERGKLSSSEKLITNDVLRNVSSKISEDIGQAMVEMVYPPKVIRKKGSQVTINRNQKTGIKLNQIWDVYEVGEDLIDPDTGVNLGKSEDLIGKIKITRVLPSYSVGDIIKDEGISVGHILRKLP